jgi:hypothetical protein
MQKKLSKILESHKLTLALLLKFSSSPFWTCDQKFSMLILFLIYSNIKYRKWAWYDFINNKIPNVSHTLKLKFSSTLEHNLHIYDCSSEDCVSMSSFYVFHVRKVTWSFNDCLSPLFYFIFSMQRQHWVCKKNHKHTILYTVVWSKQTEIKCNMNIEMNTKKRCFLYKTKKKSHLYKITSYYGKCAANKRILWYERVSSCKLVGS